MKIYQFDVRVVVADDVDEAAILEQLQFLAAELSTDRARVPPLRSQAKVSLVGIAQAGDDLTDQGLWNARACDALGKNDQLDLFDDMRDQQERRRRGDVTPSAA